ncbi:MAG: tetratricopeptide repeat protein, partial [Planctomycetota bacterium]|nr:tetratricopeptide repeat protein [Planctomycetota bacterium]
ALLAAFLCLAGGVGAAGAAEDEARQFRSYIDEGVALLKGGSRDEVSRAIAKFKSALKIRSDSAEAYYWIALAYSDQNNYLRAADNAKEATIYDERLAEAWLLWGQTLLYDKKWPEALEKLETAARLEPDDPLILFNLGRVHYHGLGDPGSAYASFNRIWRNSQNLRRDNPGNVSLILRARLYMGYCEFDRGQWANAINAFLDVLREEPGNRDASLRLAIAYRKSDRAGECEDILQGLLRSIPPDTLSNRQFLAEVNLQLADLYLKDPVMRNRLFVLAHLQAFVDMAGDSSHPALEPAREYLSRNSVPES